MMEADATFTIVMPGLDPGIHQTKQMECRVKPGNDNGESCFEPRMTNE